MEDRTVEDARYFHCFERAGQRYGLTISRKDLSDIEMWIVERCPEILRNGGDRIVKIPFQGFEVVVGFDSLACKVMTFLPVMNFSGNPYRKMIDLVGDEDYRA